MGDGKRILDIVAEGRNGHLYDRSHGEFGQHIFAYSEGEPDVGEVNDGHDRTSLPYQFTYFREEFRHLSVARREEVFLGFCRRHFLKDTIHFGYLCLCSGFIFFACTRQGHLILAACGLDRCFCRFILRLYLVAFLRGNNPFVIESLHTLIALTIDLLACFGFLIEFKRPLYLFVTGSVLGFLVNGFCHLTSRQSLGFLSLHFRRIDHDECVTFLDLFALFIEVHLDTSRHFTGHAVLCRFGFALDEHLLGSQRDETYDRNNNDYCEECNQA